jgi:AraC family ethanolamine operon transcriptional activator
MHFRHAGPVSFFQQPLDLVAVGARARDPYLGNMSCISHPQVVRRALAVVTEYAGGRPLIADLCRAAGVSERTLRNAFHDVHGLSPKQYLLRHVLEDARQALQVARGTRGAVTLVATEHGFFELGRFAGAYRQLFGERPSDTLRRASEL